LSDFQMPVMSGIDLATELSLERPQLKVVDDVRVLEGNAYTQ
jgi:hypothetical protein